MRLIDADALYKNVTEKYYDIVAGCYPFNIVAYDMANMVKDAPTVEPAQGEWMLAPTFNEYECSNCKSMISLSDDANAHPNFCPNCGASMKKKV